MPLLDARAIFCVRERYDIMSKASKKGSGHRIIICFLVFAALKLARYT
jgi:hypothetical protein